METGARVAGYSLLLVEDDEAAIDVLRFVISKRYPDLAVEVAYDGRMGLEMFKRLLPDIVITDINMPVMDGLAMSREIKAIRAATKIIVVTAYNERIHQGELSELGISFHVLKPVRFDRLFAAIDEVLREIGSERSPLGK